MVFFRQTKQWLSNTPALNREGILRNLAYLSSSSVIAQIMMAINAFILARYLGPDHYGLFVATYAALGLTSFLFNWGLDTWLLRQASISEKPDKLLGTVIALKAVFGLIWSIAVLVIFPKIRPDLYLPALVLVAALDIWADGFFYAEISALNAKRRVRTASRLLLLSRGSRLFNTLLLITFGFTSPLVFAGGRLLGTLIATTSSLIILMPTFGSELIQRAKETFKASIPYGLSDLLSIIYLQADITMIALITGSSQQVGLYAPASSLISALFVIPLAGFYVIVPVLTRMHQSGAPGFRKMAWTLLGGFSVFGFAFALAIWLGGPMIASVIFGQAYQQTGQLLRILSPILFLKTISFASAAILVAVNWQSSRLVPQIISAATNILLNLLIIQQFGIVGVAYVYVISESILVIGYLWMTGKWFRMNPAA